MAPHTPALLAADVGTSSLKAVLYDHAGQVLKVAVRRYSYTTPQPGWAEGDPEAWWTAFWEATRELAAGWLGPGSGRCGRIHRSDAFRRAARRRAAGGAADDSVARSQSSRGDRGAAEAPGTAALSAQQHVHPPQAALAEPSSSRNSGAGVRTILWPKDYLRFRLSGLVGTDLTECGGAALLDWSHQDLGVGPACADRSGRRASLPPILPADAQLSVLPRPDVAGELGLNPRPGHHQRCGRCGGADRRSPATPRACRLLAGQFIDDLHGAWRRSSRRTIPRDRLYVYPFLPPYRLAGGVSSTTGASLVWMLAAGSSGPVG